MFRILSDSEVVLNELLVACRESVDHYQDSIDTIKDTDIAVHFRSISDRRKLFLIRLTVAIRELGDLPSVPDPDKEVGEMIINHLGASLSADDTEYIVAHRIKTDKHIQSLIDNAKEIEMEKPHRSLVQDLSQHIEETIKELSSLI